MIRCPYCLRRVRPGLNVVGNDTIYKCPGEQCGKAIHRDYIEKTGRYWLRGSIGLVGFTGHGKTCYLTSLFYLLKYLKRIDTWGEEFTWETLDKNTNRIMYEHVSDFEKESKLPPSTPANFPEPALIKFEDMPFFGNFFLSFYDTAGIVFRDIERITERGRYVAHCEVVLFIISMIDCGETVADMANTMEKLLDTYINAVYNHLRVDLKKNQHLIVVLNKADEISTQLPYELSRFLQAGSYKWYRTNNVKSKVKELENKSGIIEQWLKQRECGGFTRLAKRRFRSVEYTIVSSLGARPAGDYLTTELKPEDSKRVLDPLYLALEKIRPKGLWEKVFGGR